MSALAPMEGMTPARGDVGVEKGGNPHRRMLPQLLRSGMKVAQEGI
jgi:hypothetical protein